MTDDEPLGSLGGLQAPTVPTLTIEATVGSEPGSSRHGARSAGPDTEQTLLA